MMYGRLAHSFAVLSLLGVYWESTGCTEWLSLRCGLRRWSSEAWDGQPKDEAPLFYQAFRSEFRILTSQIEAKKGVDEFTEKAQGHGC